MDSLVKISLPLDSVHRIVVALERIATAAESLSAYVCIPLTPPTYSKGSHTTETNYALIADIESLAADRARQGLPPLTTEESVLHLRNKL